MVRSLVNEVFTFEKKYGKICIQLGFCIYREKSVVMPHFYVSLEYLRYLGVIREMTLLLIHKLG